MDPQETASLTAILAPLLGVKTAGIVSLITALVVIAGQIMPYLPVADAKSSGWYSTLYGVLARVTGSRGNNSPMPASMQPAGGIVPTPPVLKPTTEK